MRIHNFKECHKINLHPYSSHLFGIDFPLEEKVANKEYEEIDMGCKLVFITFLFQGDYNVKYAGADSKVTVSFF